MKFTNVRSIVFENGKLYTMHREKQTRTGLEIYDVIIGGNIEGSETLEECCIRECFEEVGVKVKPIRLCYITEEKKFGRRQAYFLCEKIAGEFGTGIGEEFQANLDPKRGSYLPTLLTLQQLKKSPFKPSEVKDVLIADWEKFGETLCPEIITVVCKSK